MPKGSCLISGCESERFARGWCRKHYARWFRTGDTVLQERTYEDRLFGKINRDHPRGCWVWTGWYGTDGYGRFDIVKADGRQSSVMAHRAVYEAARGEIPAGLEIDHLCRNRACVNPDHLEPVTRLVNINRVPKSLFRHQALKTHCKRGHEFTPENTAIFNGKHRRCRTCARERARKYRAQQRR